MLAKATRTTVALLIVVALTTVAWAPAAAAQPLPEIGFAQAVQSSFLVTVLKQAAAFFGDLLNPDTSGITVEGARKEMSSYDPFGLD